jgi:hypothetical protein
MRPVAGAGIEKTEPNNCKRSYYADLPSDFWGLYPGLHDDLLVDGVIIDKQGVQQFKAGSNLTIVTSY